MNRSSRCIRVMAVLAIAAITVAGCADSRMAASNAASSSAAGTQASSGTKQAQQSTGDQTGYGLYNNGFTTDLYTELFGSNKRDDKSAPLTVSSPVASGPAASGPVVAGPVQQAQPASAPGGTQQETAAAEPPYATVYGIPSNGNTTDLYTELFGPRRRE